MRADPGLKLAGDTRYADWLLWEAPWLAGRVAEDARYELYSAAQLTEFQKLLGAAGPDWKRSADGYRLLVLNRAADSGAVTAFLREPGARLLYGDRQAVVILRSRAQA
jgi:hypothetical protein